MAANTYQIGNTMYRRSVKQGAPKKSPELLRRHVVAVRLTDTEYREYMAARRESYLPPSEFAALVMFLGVRGLSVTDNCSIQ